MRLFQKIIEHYKQASWFTRITDFLFYALVIALIIPSSRTWVIAHAQRLVMWSPSYKKQPVQLSEAQLQWYVLDMQGNMHRLADYKGKVIFINFWATWCAPCLAELPSMQGLYDYFKSDPNVVFLFVTDENLVKAKSFLQQKGFDLPVYQLIVPPPQPLYSNSIPSTYVIDKHGRIVIEAHRSKRWDSRRSIQMIKKLIREK